MAHDETNRTDRRTFLQAGALATAAALSAGPRPARRRQDAAAKTPIAAQAEAGQDRRRDHDARAGGRSAGAAPRPPAPALLRQRRPHLRHRQGLRHRARLQEVVRAGPEVRKEIVLVTKDMPRRPRQTAGDARQAAGGPGDRLRRPLLHPRAGRRPHASTTPSTSSRARNSRRRPRRSASRARPSSSASRPTTRTAPRSSRRRPRGASSTRSCSSTRPWLDKDSPLNKALDACHEEGDRPDLDEADRRPVLRRRPKGDILEEVVQRVPMLAEKKLSPYQGLLHAIWTDERISGSLRLDARTPTSSARTPTPPAASSR